VIYYVPVLKMFEGRDVYGYQLTRTALALAVWRWRKPDH